MIIIVEGCIRHTNIVAYTATVTSTFHTTVDGADVESFMKLLLASAGASI